MSSVGPLLATSKASTASPEGAWGVILLLLRHRRPLYMIMGVVAVLTGVVLLFLRPDYESTTVLIPPTSSSGLSGLAALAGGSGASSMILGDGALGIRNSGETYVSLLTSQTVEDDVINRFNLMSEFKTKRLSDARKVLEKRVTIFYGPRDGMIRLSALAHDPNRAAELANGYVEEFRHFSANLAVTEASKRRIFYERELNDTKEKLANAEVELKKTEDKTGVMQFDAQARALISTAAGMRAEVAAKEVQVKSLEVYATDNNPALVTAKRELSELQSQMSQLNANQANSSDGVILSKSTLSQGSVEYVRRLRDVKYYETMFELLARQFEQAQLDEARQGSTVQIVDKAMPADRKMPQHRVLIILAAVAVAFLATCVWLVLRERFASPHYAMRVREFRSAIRS